jgi:N-acetylglucosaminyldiphosphoundecaprenol N-acetyl-beta-D-mannosaminyltransferase
VSIGGGTQERLGLYLRRELNCKPSIHCIGAAIAFLSGDQVLIPRWADRMYLGWLFRCLSDPRRYMPRYWDARKLFSLMVRYGSSSPDGRKRTSATGVELATAIGPSTNASPTTSTQL